MKVSAFVKIVFAIANLCCCYLQMAPTRKGDKKKSPMNEVITKEVTIHLHKRIHGM